MADVEIDICAIRRNAKKIAERSRLIAVIKADAYGHGMTRTAEALAGIADMFAVATEDEARSLLENGIKDKDILILHPYPRPGISSGSVIYTLSDVSVVPAFKGMRTAVKLNTGMNRFGADDGYARALLKEASVNTKLHSVYSHLRCATDADMSRMQIMRFEKITRGFENIPGHIASSGALVRGNIPYGTARCGIALYGGFGYERAMSVYADVIETRLIGAGSGAGYGKSVLSRDKRVAVIDIGYAHGYRRSSVGGHVFLGGKPRKVLSVCMDCTITECGRDTRRGDRAEIMGEHIPPSELANKYRTVEYEVFTSFGGAGEKRYV